MTIDCHPSLVAPALYRLAGPGHRCCAVQRESERTRIWAYLPRSATAACEIGRLYVGLRLDARARKVPGPRVEWTPVGSWDWPDAYKAGVQPRAVGQRLLVVPHWMDVAAGDRTVVRIDSRLGFGSGSHPTTRMCLEALERRLDARPAGRRPTIADVGCGSGVLAIAAVRLGAGRVVAVDTKASAVTGTEHNRGLNGIGPDRLRVAEGSVGRVREMLPGPANGVVCNILAPVIAGLSASLCTAVKPGGWGLLSGIGDADVPTIVARVRADGWEVEHVNRREGWACVEVRRPGPVAA